MPVVVTPVNERDVPASIKLVGTVRPDRRSVVAAEVSGVIAELKADEGQLLKAGEVICRIDPRMAELRLAEAEALRDGLKAKLEELTSGTREETLRKQKAVVDEAQAMFTKSEYEHKRMTDLFQRGQGNEKEKIDAEQEFLAAERRLRAAQAEYDLWQHGARKEEIAKATFDVAAQEAIVNRLARDLEKTNIRAPFDGFLTVKRTEMGEWIEEGGPVAEMLSIEKVRVRADVPESAIVYARAGEPATVEVEALGQTAEAKVSRVIPEASAAARTFPIEVDLPNAEHTVLPGMFVWVRVPSGPAGKRLMVNKDAIVAQGTSKQIFVIRPAPPVPGGPPGGTNGAGGAPGQMAMPLPVTTGLELGGEIEVQAPGLAAGDLVVSRANERLFGPTPVIPMPDKQAVTNAKSD